MLVSFFLVKSALHSSRVSVGNVIVSSFGSGRGRAAMLIEWNHRFIPRKVLEVVCGTGESHLTKSKQWSDTRSSRERCYHLSSVEESTCRELPERHCWIGEDGLFDVHLILGENRIPCCLSRLSRPTSSQKSNTSAYLEFRSKTSSLLLGQNHVSDPE